LDTFWCTAASPRTKAEITQRALLGRVRTDCVAKIQNCLVINFPLQDKPTDDQRSV
jgi:hypothetical protein